MLKSFARAAGFLAYLFITLEMLFMVTPFALCYYSVYGPLLAGPFGFSATAWLPAFFLPHLSTEILPSIGGVDFFARFGWLRPECFSTLLCQIQAARGGRKRFLQTH